MLSCGIKNVQVILVLIKRENSIQEFFKLASTIKLGEVPTLLYLLPRLTCIFT